MRRSVLPLATLALAGALLLAACGASPSATSGGSAPTADAMAGMDHSGIDHGTSPTADAMAGMDHGGMDHGTAGVPYDASFIDGMIAHHQGAIVMANQALNEAQRPELKALAQTIIADQQGEIARMQEWRAAWFPDLAPTDGMAMDMGPIEVPAGETPFDQRFLQAMIPHHQAAVTMAQDALENAERQEIKDQAQTIITAQQAEIAQMQQWLQEWYNISH